MYCNCQAMLIALLEVLTAAHAFPLHICMVHTRRAWHMAAGHHVQGSQDVSEAAHNLQDTLDHATEAANSNQETSERRARVKDLFYAMDKDGNGKLDVGEFRGICCFAEELKCSPCAPTQLTIRSMISHMEQRSLPAVCSSKKF